MNDSQKSNDAGIPGLVQAIREQTAAMVQQAAAINRLIDYLTENDVPPDEPVPPQPKRYLSGGVR